MFSKSKPVVDESTIAAEYSDYSAKLERLSTLLGKLIVHITSVDGHWTTVLKSQHAFTADIESGYPASSPMKTCLTAANTSVSTVERDITSVKSKHHPTRSEVHKLKEYKNDVDKLLKERKGVEKLHAGYVKNTSKADRLVVKASKAEDDPKAAKKVAQSQERKDAAETAYHGSCEEFTAKMKALHARSPAMLKGAHKTFWVVQAGAAGVVSDNAAALSTAKLPEDVDADAGVSASPGAGSTTEKADEV